MTSDVSSHRRPRPRPPGRWVVVGTAVLLVLVAVVVVQLARGGGRKLVWSDEFSGAAGASPGASWVPVTGGDGWGNGELECYTSVPGNADLDGRGDLDITALYDPGHRCSDGHTDDYTSARLITLGRQSFRYGSVEVRAQMPTGSGAWPAIWAQGTDYPTVGWPQCGEIDISEVVGSHPDQTRASLHGAEPGGQPYDITGTKVVSTRLSAGFHTYGMTWTPDRLSFTLDGKTYLSETKAQVTAQGAWPFDKPFYLLLDLAVGGNLPGSPDASATWPQHLLVDYVRVYGS